jgi:hypothetical protein
MTEAVGSRGPKDGFRSGARRLCDAKEVMMRLVRHLLAWLGHRWGRYARRRAVLKQMRRWRAEERRRAFGRVENYAPAHPPIGLLRRGLRGGR